jgi:hypothetical protein
MVPALGLYPVEPDKATDDQARAYHDQIRSRLAWGMLAGLNAGLGAGLAMAYLPDQTVYGPSWQRVIMVDLAGVAGAIFATTIEICTKKGTNYCANNSADNRTKLNGRSARYALAGAGLGLVAGWLLTMNYDHNNQARPAPPLLSHIPLPGVVPVQSTSGTAELLPGLISQGQF